MRCFNGALLLQSCRASISTLLKEKQELVSSRRHAYWLGLDDASPSELYLVQSYRRGWRFHKLWCFMEKIFLVCIPFFFAERWNDLVHYVIACFILGFMLLTSLVFRAYADPFEYAMDLSARCVHGCMWLVACDASASLRACT